jgi:ATP-dependent RNA helicase DDX5/DBP2
MVVLDEADKMLSVGFEPQLLRLQAMLLHPHGGAAAAGRAAPTEAAEGKAQRKQRKAAAESTPAAAAGASGNPQVLLFSATMPAAVQQTAKAWLPPGFAAISCSAGADSISRTITQVWLWPLAWRSELLRCVCSHAKMTPGRLSAAASLLAAAACGGAVPPSAFPAQVVQVCAEHKKPAKLLKHLAAIKAASAGLRNPPRVLVFANRIKVCAGARACSPMGACIHTRSHTVCVLHVTQRPCVPLCVTRAVAAPPPVSCTCLRHPCNHTHKRKHRRCCLCSARWLRLATGL